jgi:hypothetical protein
MEMDSELKQELLELRSGAERLARLARLLTQVVSGYEERASTHKLAKGNGHGKRKINLDD